MISGLAATRPRHRWFAAVYDRMARMDEKKARPIREFVAGGATGAVLEIGCGTGLNLDFYDWSKVERLEATEPDVFMLRRAEARAAKLPEDVRARVRLQEAPAESLPFDAVSFDTVVSSLVFCTVSDPAASLEEVGRVLKPGGELRLFEHVQAEGKTATVQRFIQPLYGWMSGGCQLSRQTESAVRQAGFDLEITQRTALGPLWPAFVGVARKSTTQPAP